MIEYVVSKDDTLKKISDYYGVSIDEIKSANNLTSDILEEGMVLKIPFTITISYYTVKEGDDLYSIANKYKMPVEVLARLNGLKVGDYIYANQKIIVPKEGYSIYITNSGDNILGLSSQLDIPVEEILKGNQTLYLLPEQLIIYKEK